MQINLERCDTDVWRCSDEMNVLTWERSRPYTDKSFVHLEQRYTKSITILPENAWHFLIHCTLSKNKTVDSFNILSIKKHWIHLLEQNAIQGNTLNQRECL